MELVQDVAVTIGWTFLGVMLFYAGIRLFDRLDPIDYQAEIRQGNVAASVILAALILGLAVIIATVILA